MLKSEENDILILVHSLSNSEVKLFVKTYTLEATNVIIESSNLKYLLFSNIRKKKEFDSLKFIKTHKLTKKQYNSIKHLLFQDILNFIKNNYDKYSDIALENRIIEFELLVTNGFFLKANRKMSQIKKIAYEKCSFSICIRVQRKAIKYQLFNFEKDNNARLKDFDELKEFHKLSDNLNAYISLSDEVLNFHYTCLDKRSKNTQEILKYLNHELLLDEKKGTFCFSKILFF